MAGLEYKGKEIVYAIEIVDEVGENLIRPFNQTGGSTNISSDSVELSTKDKTGSDYGDVTQEVSLEGIITEGDPFVDFIKTAIRAKEFVKIYEINTRTMEAEHGMYQISSFERSFGNGDFATYTLSGALNGNVTPVTLTELPGGAE
ncbi:phage major tail protein, TP901-1 family [Cytobacillus sp. FSL R7-0696]|uniref:phage major tail protein, TP901-1 family n=1 Tax=Cytobacillus sp. FSL R7-0696 TaxID=2921691 RepID=UPI0030FBD546